MEALARRPLDTLLWGTVAIPALAFAYGTRDGQVAFVLYRDPKLVAVQVLGWLFLAALFWSRSADLRLSHLTAKLLRPPWAWLSLFLTYGLVTLLWVAVPENLLLELAQYALLLLLVLALDAWTDRNPAVSAIVQRGLVLSLGAATLVGVIQGAFPLQVLSPVDPGSGVANPSFMGYKNPMALFLLGQIFLLGHLAVSREAGRTRRLLVLLLAVELVYLASLKSRTSYLALAGSVAFLIVLLAVRERFGRRLILASLGTAVLLGLFAVVLRVDPGARQRVDSAFAYIARPAAYLESDRGTYLLNSLNMVRHNPWGVGLGDWQTQYPVYRLHNRYVYFSETEQVNKAHSDHVQFLAEIGWPGLALWIGFWVALLAPLVRRYLHSGDPGTLLLAAQLAAFGIAMMTDFVVEHPYGKLQFLLVAFLAVRATSDPPQAQEVSGPASRALAWGVTALAIIFVALSLSMARKVYLAAAMTERYQEALDRGGDPRLLEEASRLGQSFTRLPGHTRDLCADYLVLADTSLRLGEKTRARAYAREALRLHPYLPNAMRLLENLEPERAAAWHRATEYVLHEATRGPAGPLSPRR